MGYGANPHPIGCVIVDSGGARFTTRCARPTNAEDAARVLHAWRSIPAFINNHLAMQIVPNLYGGQPLLLHCHLVDNQPHITNVQVLTTGPSATEPCSVATISRIQPIWRALQQLTTIGWCHKEAPVELLRHIFPEYTVGVSTVGRAELKKQFDGMITGGSQQWQSVNDEGAHPSCPSPVCGYAPSITSILQLFGGMTSKNASEWCRDLLGSPMGNNKCAAVSHFLLSLATKAHAKVSSADNRETVVDHEQRQKHGRTVTYALGPHTVLTAIIKTMVSGLRASCWLHPWKSARYGWTLNDTLPRFVYSWVQAHDFAPFHEFERNMAYSNSIPLREADFLQPDWVRLISSPGVITYLKRVPAMAPYHQGVQFPAVKIKANASRAQLKVLNQLFPYTSTTDRNHMTMHLADLAYYLINTGGIAVSTLVKSGTGHYLQRTTANKSGRVSHLNKLLGRIPLGTNNILAMHCILTAYGTGYSYLADRAFLQLPTLVGSSYEVLQRLKALSYLARRGQADADGNACPDKAVSFIAYAELAFGRSGNVTDWDEEYRNRCLGSIHIQAPRRLDVNTSSAAMDWAPDADLVLLKSRPSSDRFYTALRSKIRAICQPLVTRRATTETMPDFLLRRAEWMASGSSGGGTIALSDIPSYVSRQAARGQPPTKERVKVAKRAWAETVPQADLLKAFRTQKPREAAQASEKFENGKSRAIYGVEPLHYIINTYATKGFEEKLHLVPGLEKGVTGLRMCQLEHHRALITSDKGQHCTMLDYADFNRHHTPTAQAILFEELESLGSEVGACADWRFANRWVAKAKYNMSVKLPNHQGENKVHQGMFSGTKSTDLINTVLNLAYFQVTQDYVASEYGCVAEDLYHVHQGDDVWLSNRNHLWARLMYYTMHQMGFIFQKSKQMFGEGRGEYLRVLYQNGDAGGYLHRALANFILRPLQNDSTQDPIAWAHTIQDGVATLSRRGLPQGLAQLVWTNCMNYWVKAKSHSKDKQGVRIPRTIIELAPENGGLGCPLPGSIVLAGGVYGFPELKHNPKQLAGVPMHMTDDWIQHVSKHSTKMEALYTIRSDALREMSLHTSYASLPEHIIKAEAWPVYKEEIRKWRDDNSAKLSRRSKRYTCTDSKQLAQALTTHYSLAAGTNPSRPLLQNIAQIEAPPSIEATEYMGLSNTLNKLVASSRFKSISATATAYGSSKHQALTTILAAASEDTSASQDARFDIQYILSRPTLESVALLQRPGSSALNALAPFIDSNLLGYCSSQANQVIAKHAAIFGSDAAVLRSQQAAQILQLSCNTISANPKRFKRVRY